LSQNTSKSVLFVSTAKIFSLFSILAASILVARATEPIEFGYYSVAISLILLVEALTGAPLDNAAVRFSSLNSDSPARIERVLGYVFKLKFALGLFIFGVVVWFLSPLTESLLDEAAPRSILPIAVLSLISILLVRSSASFLQIQGRFNIYARVDFIQGLLRIALMGGLYLFGCASVVVYLAAYCMSTLLTFFVSLFLYKQEFVLAALPTTGDRRVVFSYIGVTSAIVVLGAISGRADVPILSVLGGAQQAAYYSVASQLAAMGTLFASYFAIVFQPKVIQMAHDKTLNKAINKNIFFAILISLMTVPIAVFLSPMIIPLIFGEAYAASAFIFNILILGICADLVTLPILLPYAIQMIPGRILVGEIVITVVFLISVLLLLGVDVVVMAWVVTAVRVAKLFMYYVLVKISLRRQEAGQLLAG